MDPSPPLTLTAATLAPSTTRAGDLRASSARRRRRPAQHRARLSADLADHLAAGSQAIDVIVHGDAGGGRRAGARATTCR